MAKPLSKQQEALQFLDDLDSFSPAPPPASGATPKKGTTPATNEGEAAEVLAFLDEITQKSSEPTKTTSLQPRPASRVSIRRSDSGTLRQNAEGTKKSVDNSSELRKSNLSESTTAPAPVQDRETTASASQGGWGWGSVWSSASAAIQQARTVVDEQVKQLPQTDQAKKWGEGVMGYVKNAQLDKISHDIRNVGLSTLTDILNVVAPPIAEHEVIQVWLSHDMQGYEGVESLVYRAMARIMEQVEGGDLIVNKGDESRPKDGGATSERNLNAVDGFDAAYKLSEANLEELIEKNESKPPPSQSKIAAETQNPTTYSTVYLRIQPFLTTFAVPSQSESAVEKQQLQFLLHLSDPSHALTHTTQTQAVPNAWIDLWEENEWVEDLVVEVLRVGVEVIGQEYLVRRMGWEKGKGKAKAVDNA